MPPPRHRARLLLSYPPLLADALHGALSPETTAEVPKTTGAVSRNEGGLVVDLAAADLPSLRAAVNSYLRWVDAAERAARAARP